MLPAQTILNMKMLPDAIRRCLSPIEQSWSGACWLEQLHMSLLLTVGVFAVNGKNAVSWAGVSMHVHDHA